MKIALSITVEKKSDGSVRRCFAVAPQWQTNHIQLLLYRGYRRACSDIIYGIFHVPAVYERFGVVPVVYERLALKTAETAGLVKFAGRRGKE